VRGLRSNAGHREFVRAALALDRERAGDLVRELGRELGRGAIGGDLSSAAGAIGNVPTPIQLRLAELGEEKAFIVVVNANSSKPVRFEVPINWAIE
jgi:hypothetical protein